MKINNNTCPILPFLDKPNLKKLNGLINVRDEDLALWNNNSQGAAKTAQYVIDELYKGYIAERCGRNTYVLMQKFIDSINNSVTTFRNISRGIQLEKLFEDCCIVAGDIVYIAYKLTKDTYFGKEFISAESPNNYLLSLYYQGKTTANRNKNIIYLGSIVFSKETDEFYRIELALLSNVLELKACDYNHTEQIIDRFLAVLIFKHYAKVELDIIYAGERKNSSVFNQKIINESAHAVQIMDSNWYTSIYRTEKYSVSGHIRYYKKQEFPYHKK